MAANSIVSLDGSCSLNSSVKEDTRASNLLDTQKAPRISAEGRLGQDFGRRFR